MEEQDFEQLLTKITMPWFYSKPVIFSIYCKHKIKPNPKCSMPFRSGKGFIEYNPQEIAKLEIPKSRKLLEMELYRLMLRHPYRRKPENCDDTLWYMASNMVIDPKYAVSQGLPYNQNIEFYYDELLKRKKNRKGKTVEIPPEESFEEEESRKDEKKPSEELKNKRSDNEEEDDENQLKKSEKEEDEKKEKKKINKKGKAEADKDGPSNVETEIEMQSKKSGKGDDSKQNSNQNGKPGKGNGKPEESEDETQNAEKNETEQNGKSGDSKSNGGKTAESHDENQNEKQDGKGGENNGSNEKQNDREQTGEQNNGTNGNSDKLDNKEENKGDSQSSEKKDKNNGENDEENNEGQADNSTDKKGEQNAAAEDNGDATDLWGEDILEDEKITKIIELYSDRKSWGAIPENILRETEKVRIQKVSDLKKKIEKFRESISKSNRVLTRMRPNRRTGFDQMGSRYKLRPTKFLVGMDVSGSITDYHLSLFNTIALDICKKENAQMDILPFDANLKPLCKKIKSVQKYTGGGGTNFQPLINYVQKHSSKYDGLIVFTDGYAPKPVIKTNLRIKILWVIINKEGVQNWMNKRDFAAVIEENDNPKTVVYVVGPDND